MKASSERRKAPFLQAVAAVLFLALCAYVGAAVYPRLEAAPAPEVREESTGLALRGFVLRLGDRWYFLGRSERPPTGAFSQGRLLPEGLRQPMPAYEASLAANTGRLLLLRLEIGEEEPQTLRLCAATLITERESSP